MYAPVTIRLPSLIPGRAKIRSFFYYSTVTYGYDLYSLETTFSCDDCSVLTTLGAKRITRIYARDFRYQNSSQHGLSIDLEYLRLWGTQSGGAIQFLIAGTGQEVARGFVEIDLPPDPLPVPGAHPAIALFVLLVGGIVAVRRHPG